MLLLGMFYSVDKPVMNMYLRPIIDDILQLFREGMKSHMYTHVVSLTAFT